MFYSPQSSIDEFFVHGTHVLNYLEGQSEAQLLLARYGMDGMRLQEGRLLLNQVQAIHWQTREQRRQQKASTAALHSELRQARQIYRRHRQAARDVLDADARSLLRAGSRGYASWLAQAQEFYAAMLSHPGYQEKLATVDISADQLLRASQLMDAIMARKTAQTQNREGSRTRKEQRDELMREAKSWFDVLMSVAQVAFRKQPGFLEAIYTLPAHLSQEQKARKLARTEATRQSTTTAGFTPTLFAALGSNGSLASE